MMHYVCFGCEKSIMAHIAGVVYETKFICFECMEQMMALSPKEFEKWLQGKEKPLNRTKHTKET